VEYQAVQPIIPEEFYFQFLIAAVPEIITPIISKISNDVKI